MENHIKCIEEMRRLRAELRALQSENERLTDQLNVFRRGIGAILTGVLDSTFYCKGCSLVLPNNMRCDEPLTCIMCSEKNEAA